MIGTAFAPEPMPSIEALRSAIEEPQTSNVERVVYRCSLFYSEALVELHTRSIASASIVRACMEAMLAASACLRECSIISSESDLANRFGNVAGYGFVQALTQIAEAVTGLEHALAIDIKRKFGSAPTLK